MLAQGSLQYLLVQGRIGLGVGGFVSSGFERTAVSQVPKRT